VFGKTVWRRLFVPWREATIGVICIMRSFIYFTLYQTWLGWSTWREWDGQDVYHVWKSWEMYAIVSLENVGLGGKTVYFLRKYFVRDWTTWFKIWASDSHLCAMYLTYGCLWNRSSDVTEQHLVSQKGLYSMELLLFNRCACCYVFCAEDSGFRNKQPVPLNYTLAQWFPTGVPR